MPCTKAGASQITKQLPLVKFTPSSTLSLRVAAQAPGSPFRAGPSTMATFKPLSVKDVSAEDFIKAYAAHLKSNDKIHLPTWVDIVKTASYKELSPYDEDWYFVRAAALCRRLYIRPGQGVGRFEHAFGGRARRGARPEIRAEASGGVIRHILKNLESVGLLEKHPDGGRKLTPSGQRDMDLIAGRVPVTLQEF